MGFETGRCVSTEQLIAGQTKSCEGRDVQLYIIMQMLLRMGGENKHSFFTLNKLRTHHDRFRPTFT